MLRGVDRQRDRRPKIAWRDVGGAPLHPGAKRFYREMGYLK